MKCTRSLSWTLFYFIFIGLLTVTQSAISLAQVNPCAAKAKKGGQNPCAASNPCAAKNPCAANPCAPGAQASAAAGKALMVRGDVAQVDPGSGQLVLKSEGKQINLKASKYLVVREGPKVKSLAALKPGERVTVSYVESGKDRTAWYVYLASASSAANPCAANPCAATNPCAAKNPCAANPCAPKAKKASQNPCAVKNPCAPKK